MRKITIANSILTLLLLGYFLYDFTSSSKDIAYVDTSQLINNYEGMAEARKEYKGKAAQWKANIDTLFAEVQSEIKSYEKESVSMTKKEKELALKLIDSKKKNFQQYQKAIEQKAQTEDEKMTTLVISEINGFIKNFGRKHGYEIIFGATDMGNIVYANDAINLTDQVTEALNKKYNE